MTLYYSITFGLLVLEVVTFLVLIMPLPFAWRRKLFKFLAVNPSEYWVAADDDDETVIEEAALLTLRSLF